MKWDSLEHPTLHHLWNLAVATLKEVRAMARRGSLPAGDWQLSRAARRSSDTVFDPIGLVLVRPPEQFGYEDTPSNSLAFAKTGVEGVHFSFVLPDGPPTARSPVVMTVPLCYANIIVGADLDEFLGLGMFRRYFALEDLAREPVKTADAYASREPWPDDDASVRWLIRRFAEGMNLRPWADVRARLNQLQREYSPLLRWDHAPSGVNNLQF